MHTYERVAHRDADGSSPGIDTYRFRSAQDVASFASRNPYIGSISWPEVWHLDEHGELICYYKADSLSSLKRWADDPSDLFRSRRAGLRTGACPGDWLIVESRPWSKCTSEIVDEGDEEAFLIVQESLESIDVRLVDAVVFDDDCHWWSMHELTSGESAWLPASELSA